MGLATGKTRGYVIPRPVRLELVDNGEALSSVEALMVVDPGLEEPLMTDATIDELGIEAVSFKKGLWRHRGDPQGKVRGSATP